MFTYDPIDGILRIGILTIHCNAYDATRHILTGIYGGNFARLMTGRVYRNWTALLIKAEPWKFDVDQVKAQVERIKELTMYRAGSRAAGLVSAFAGATL